MQVMHQSIPEVPIPPPPGSSRAFAHILILGVGGIWHLAAARGAGHLPTPRIPRGIWQPHGFGLVCGRERKHGLHWRFPLPKMTIL